MSLKIYCHYHPLAQLLEDPHAGDQICSECGLVVGDRVIDVGSEWRTFSNDNGFTEDRNRVGAAENKLFNGSNLFTRIQGATHAPSYDENGTPRYRNTSQSSSDKVLREAYRDIDEMAHKLSMPACISDRAKFMFKQVEDSRGIRGRSTGSKATACLYIACRQEGCPRTFKEICAVSECRTKSVKRAFMHIVQLMGLSVEIIKSDDYMSRFCAKLEVSRDVQRVANSLACKASERGLVLGRSPISVAAAAIYMAMKAADYDGQVLKRVSEICGVADATIRESCKLIGPHAISLLPDEDR